jgi:signal transduction histidine kinase
MMKGENSSFATSYRKSLGVCLKSDKKTDLSAAHKLGRKAVRLGLDTLDLARIHEQALLELDVSNAPKAKIRKTGLFFAEALTPIAETSSVAKLNKIEMKRLNKMLSLRSQELIAANRQLQQGIARRKRIESAFKESGDHYKLLLKNSMKLQVGLRRLTHQVLASQDNERKEIGRQLSDEIAQNLLGINVRMQVLKKEARRNDEDLKNEIADTQKLVLQSEQSVRRVGRELRMP